MTAPVVFIAGLARCGTSLTMQMLAAGGLPCAGTFPDFEVDSVDHRPIDPAFMSAHVGHAVKWLNPHLAPAPAGATYITIWLDRRPGEQAKSQAKFLHLMTGMPYPTRYQLRGWAAILRRDRARAMRALGSRPTLIIDFEALVTAPRRTAQRVAGWLSPWFAVDPVRMAAAALARSPECQAGLEIEARLAGRAGP